MDLAVALFKGATLIILMMVMMMMMTNSNMYDYAIIAMCINIGVYVINFTRSLNSDKRTDK